MASQNIKFKAPRSHAIQEWTVYPWVESENEIILQSDNKIAKYYRKEAQIQISKASSSGYTRVSDLAGRALQDCPIEVIEQFKAFKPTGKVVRL